MSRKEMGRVPDLVYGEVGKGSLMSTPQLRSESGCCCGLEPGDLGRCQLCSDPADSRLLDTRSDGSQPRLGCTEEEMNILVLAQRALLTYDRSPGNYCSRRVSRCQWTAGQARTSQLFLGMK